MRNVKDLTLQFQAIPKERFREKLSRTLAGLFLVVLGFGMFYLGSHGLVSKDTVPWVERIALGCVALGGWSASSEFLKAPIKYGIAVAKDILELVRGKDGTPTRT